MAPGIQQPYTPTNATTEKVTHDVVASPTEASKYLLDQEDADDDYSRMPLAQKILWGLFYTAFALVALYFFVVAVKLIGEGLTLALGCDTKGAFDFADNPIAGLMVGTVATALIHSSSTVTSIVVALVGARGMTIRQAVPVIMGANIGTCITCIMVAFGQVGDRAQFERAMAAATVHDMYNIWSVIIMFPIEVLFHPLEELSKAMANTKTDSGAFKSPIDAVVNPLTSAVIEVDKKAINKIATGEKTCKPGTSFLKGGWFEDAGLSDGAVGAIVASIGFVILVCALIMLVKTLSRVFLGPTKRAVAKVLNYNGYVNILAGTALTFLVNSSTIVTSTLTPMAGLGVIKLEQVYPIVIGSNLGTTGTALLAAMVTGKSDAVAIALVHFWFNAFGIFLFYPIPFTREPIYSWARALAHWSAAWAMSAVIFLAVTFLVAPGILLGVVALCTADGTGLVVLGYILGGLTVVSSVGLWFWYAKKGGRDVWEAFLEKKRAERLAKDQTAVGANAV